MGEANFLPATVSGAARDEIEFETRLGRVALPGSSFAAGNPVKGQRVTLCIRPEHFRPAAGDGPAISLGTARITGTAFFGTHHRCHLAAAGDIILTAHLPQTHTPEIGSKLDLRLKADSIAVLQDGAGERA
ncbi:MAG: TOBE domain-containing protein [Shinella sp.]|nr:TOBE domain-containing protein [Shinella sp.]